MNNVEKAKYFLTTIESDCNDSVKLLELYNNIFTKNDFLNSTLSNEELQLCADACIFKCIVRLANLLDQDTSGKSITLLSFLNYCQGSLKKIDNLNFNRIKSKILNVPFKTNLEDWRDKYYAHRDKDSKKLFSVDLTTYMIKEVLDNVSIIIDDLKNVIE